VMMLARSQPNDSCGNYEMMSMRCIRAARRACVRACACVRVSVCVRVCAILCMSVCVSLKCVNACCIQVQAFACLCM
jgi:hypothetical protein